MNGVRPMIEFFAVRCATMKRFRLAAVLVLVLAGTPAIFCQQITGSIVGTVTDQQGAIVDIATVKATNTETASRARPRQVRTERSALTTFQ